MQLVREVAEYYDSLAKGYHRRSGYEKENDTEGFKEIERLIADLFTDRDVLEIDCGTGYWTAMIARVARSVMATDLNRSMITEAERLLSGCRNVRFSEADAYSLKKYYGAYSQYKRSKDSQRIHLQGSVLTGEDELQGRL